MSTESLAEPAAVPALTVSSQVAVERWSNGVLATTTDLVAEEVPVALVYHDVPHVVMLATPADLEDYGVGFTLSEGLVARMDEIRGVEVTRGAGAADVRISVAWERFTQLLQRRRNLAGRTGCGLCGAETAEDAIRECAPVPDGVTISAAQLHAAIEELATRQPINARTGSVHAAAWVTPQQGIRVVREDVGRHNALDKTIGALARSERGFFRRLHAHHQPRELRDGAEVCDPRDLPAGGAVRTDRFRRAPGSGDRADARGVRTPRPACGVRKPASTEIELHRNYAHRPAHQHG